MNTIKRQAQKGYRFFSRLIIIAFIASSISACTTIALAVVAVTTIDILHDRRTAGEYIDDSSIELNATSFLLSKPEIRASAHVKPDSWNGILLLTGEIDDEQVKPEIITYMSSIQGVRQLVDETTITGKTALLARTNDVWITSKVKSSLVLRTGLRANRIKVITTRGTVYLMGIVTTEEADQATEIARGIRGVARVVKVFEFVES